VPGRFLLKFAAFCGLNESRLMKIIYFNVEGLYGVAHFRRQAFSSYSWLTSSYFMIHPTHPASLTSRQKLRKARKRPVRGGVSFAAPDAVILSERS
jgi:hypothetical protein